MSLLKCPKCGEMFSDSYKTCPFCEEDEAFANGGKKPVNPGRRVHRQKSPSILGPTLVLVLVLYPRQVSSPGAGAVPPVS